MEPRDESSEEITAGPFRHHGCRHRRHRHPGRVAGLIVITIGILLLLRELQVLPVSFRVWQLWPVILVGVGLNHLTRRGGVGHALFGLGVATIGVILLLDTLGVIAFGLGHFWPLLIVLLGLTMLFGRRHHYHRRYRFAAEQVDADFLRRSITFSGAQIKVDSQQFKGGEVSSVMGGVEIDMRHAAIAGEEAVLDLYCVMGGVEISVPEAWRVVNEITPTLGGVEDKTISMPGDGAQAKRLLLKGTVVMGAISIKN